VKFKPINIHYSGFIRVFSNPQTRSFSVCTDSPKEVVFKIGYKNGRNNWWVHHACFSRVVDEGRFVLLEESPWGSHGEIWLYPRGAFCDYRYLIGGEVTIPNDNEWARNTQKWPEV
jgi:hypothetical protein